MKNKIFLFSLIHGVLAGFTMNGYLTAQNINQSPHEISCTVGIRSLSLSDTPFRVWWSSADKAFGALKGFTGGLTYTFNMGRMNIGARLYGGYIGNTNHYKNYKNSMYFWERTFSAFAAYHAWESGPLMMDFGFSINQTGTSAFTLKRSTLGEETESFKIRGEGSYVDIFGKLTYQIHPRLAISAQVSQVALNSAVLMVVGEYDEEDLAKYPKNLIYRIESQFIIKK